MRPIGRASLLTYAGGFCGGLALALVAGACRPRTKPEEPIERTPQACCTWGDFKLQNFKGCRIPTRDCRSSKGERYWMRGYVTCGPVDEANCDGGRCCSYKPQYADDLAEPIENWKPPGFAEPTNNVTPPASAPAEAAEPSEPAEAAEPADAKAAGGGEDAKAPGDAEESPSEPGAPTPPTAAPGAP